MGIQTNALLVISIPLLGSLLIPLLGWAGLKKATGPLTVILIGAANILTWPLLLPVLHGGMWHWSYGLYRWISLSLTVDALAVFMAFTASLIATLIAIYSLGYIEHTDDEPEYYFIVTLFLGAMMGLVFSTNLIFL